MTLEGPPNGRRAARRAVGYVRVSSQEQAQDGLGLAVQEQAIVDWCRREGWELVAVYRDPGVSGTLPLHARAGMRAALGDAKEREGDPVPVGALVVARWDRLARDTLVSLLVEQEFTRHGCAVVSADGIGADQTTRELFMVLAGAERRNLVARLAAGREAKRANGGYAGGRPKVGWRAKDKTLIVDPVAASVVVGIFKAVAAGWSLRRVATHLHDDRKLGQSWDAGKVRGIVRDPRYKAGGAGKAIVDPRIWAKANAALDKRRRSHAGRAAAAA